MKNAENSGGKKQNVMHAAASSPANSECSEMSSLVDPAMISDYDSDVNDGKHAVNNTNSEVVSKSNQNTLFFT